jgi:hypothetical protein
LTLVAKSYVSQLVTDMAAYFAAQPSPFSGTSIAFGPRAFTREDNQGTGGGNRVVIGWEWGTSAGAITGARNSAGNTGKAKPVGSLRPIVTWAKRFVVSLWAYDATNAEDELAHFAAMEDLFEVTRQAILSSSHADAELGNPYWPDQAHEARMGLEMRFELIHKGPLFARAAEVVTPQPRIVRGAFT